MPIKGDAHTPDLAGFVLRVIKPTSDLGADAKTNIFVHLQPRIECGEGGLCFLRLAAISVVSLSNLGH